MYSKVLTQEFIATERAKVVLESIDGLQAVRRARGRNALQRAALDALKSAYTRSVRHPGAVIPYEAIARPIVIAQAAMEGL